MASVWALQAKAREISLGPFLGAYWLPALLPGQLSHSLLLLRVPGPIG